MGIALRHIGIVVSDLEKALGIFTNYLGCIKLNVYPEVKGEYISTLVGISSAEMKIAILKTLDDNRIELIEYTSDPVKKTRPVLSNNIGVSHFSLTVEDIGQLYEQSDTNNIRFLSTPQTSPNGFVKVAYAVIMEEILVELVQVLDERAAQSN
jgi:lactoylglutathione lyase